jgi:hypothetical protein
VIFAGITAYCIGYRIGPHMLWSSPIYNRRNPGDEVTSPTTAALDTVFGGVPPPTDHQTGLPLLFMAIILKGIIERGSPWLTLMFPALSGLAFDIPSSEPRLEEVTNYGRDIPDSSDESSSASGDHGDMSGDYVDHLSQHGVEAEISRSSAPTALVFGKNRFTGDWLGELRRCAGFSVQIGQRLSQGLHGTVYAGELLLNGIAVSRLAVKVSDATDVLLAEFSRYQDLKEVMGPSIPRCYGVCVASGTAFLVTDLVCSRDAVRDLTKAERCVV